MWKFLKMKVEVATDVTTTAEVPEVSEATEIRVVNAEVVDSDQEKKVDSEVKEVQTDQEEKADAENRVRFKEKIERQDVLRAQTDRPDVLLKRLKIASQEEANDKVSVLNSNTLNSKFQY